MSTSKAVTKKQPPHRKLVDLNIKNEFPSDAWELCKKHFAYCCAYCGRKPKVLSRDHLIPLSQGGSSNLENIIPCCQNCNNSKSNREFHLWYKNAPFYSHEREQKILNYIKSFL